MSPSRDWSKTAPVSAATLAGRGDRGWRGGTRSSPARPSFSRDRMGLTGAKGAGERALLALKNSAATSSGTGDGGGGKREGWGESASEDKDSQVGRSLRTAYSWAREGRPREGEPPGLWGGGKKA